MTLAPGHFHAALIHRQMTHGVHPRVHVYAPLDADLLTHLERIRAFNARDRRPTAWELDVRTGADFLARMLREQPGNTVVVAGRNKPKIDAILAAVRNGLHVLADKPWVVDAADFPKLEAVFAEADLREVVAWDMMTERHEVATVLQRGLMRDANVFGTVLPGSPESPALVLESVHHLKKIVAGAPLRRPGWWFDVRVAGHALADVGTHLFDLTFWLLFPFEPIDHCRDVQLRDAKIWPTMLDEPQWKELTDEDPPPANFADGQFRYQGNGTATFQVRGVHVRVTTLWDVEAKEGGGDTHEAIARGSKATVAIRKESLSRLTVTPNRPDDRAAVLAALEHRCRQWQADYPGLAAVDRGDHFEVAIPDEIRTTHEDHFAEVLHEFGRYFHQPRLVPSWEQPNMLAKYWLSTQAVKLATEKQGGASSS